MVLFISIYYCTHLCTHFFINLNFNAYGIHLNSTIEQASNLESYENGQHAYLRTRLFLGLVIDLFALDVVASQ